LFIVTGFKLCFVQDVFLLILFYVIEIRLGQNQFDRLCQRRLAGLMAVTVIIEVFKSGALLENAFFNNSQKVHLNLIKLS
jgi:hypothetical protein